MAGKGSGKNFLSTFLFKEGLWGIFKSMMALMTLPTDTDDKRTAPQALVWTFTVILRMLLWYHVW